MKDITLGELYEIAEKLNLILRFDITQKEIKVEIFNPTTNFGWDRRFSMEFIDDARGLKKQVLDYLESMAMEVSR